LPVDFDEAAVAGQVATVHLSVAVDIAVVLVNPSRTNQPQIAAGHESAPLVVNHLLRFNLDAGPSMEYAHYRFPRGLTAVVDL
jgi:hypothetical protein